MSDFNIAIKTVLLHEGGWVDNPVDPGGETMYGISMLIIRRENLTLQDLGIDNWLPGCLKKMKVEAAIALYKKLFWDKYGYGAINDQTVATKLFDAAVNVGPKRAHILAQRACTALGTPIDIDGILGPESFKTINSFESQKFVVEFARQLANYYNAIVASHPSQVIFLKNWLHRAQWGVVS
jgi:lysozyme family protein